MEWLDAETNRPVQLAARVFTEGSEDVDTLAELDEVERWIEAGSPPVEDWIRQREADDGPPLPAHLRRAYTTAETTGEGTTKKAEPEPPVVAPVPRLAFSLQEAAASLNMSDDHFRKHVKEALPISRPGRRQLVSVRALEDWLEQTGQMTFEP